MNKKYFTEEERIEARKKQNREGAKRYYEKHRNECIERCKQYQKDNREKINIYSNQYCKAHKVWIKQYQNNKEYYLSKGKNWRENNKDKIKSYYENLKKNVVYKYTEISTGELAYIGSTSSIKRRVSSRASNTISHVLFDNIYRENPENFKLEIIKEFDTYKDAYEYEYQLIKELQPKYNIYGK